MQLVAAVFSVAVIVETVRGQKKCRPSGDPVPSEVPLTAEPISQIRTIVGNCRADIRACPMGGCRYDTRLSDKCPLDGTWCKELDTTAVDCGILGMFKVEVVTSCTCCQNKGIQVTGIVVDSQSRRPLSRVQLRINKKTKTKAGSNGRFAAVIPPGATRVVINAKLKKGNYIETTRVINIPIGQTDPIDVTIAMVMMAEAKSVDASQDNKIPLAGGEAEIAMIGLLAGSLQTRKGPYEGEAMISVNYIDTSNRDVEDVIPGEFITGNRRRTDPLITDGMFALTLRSDSGATLRAKSAVVRVRSGMRLWTLSSDGVWKPISSSKSRNKRQIALDEEFIIDINSATWVNIDKIPGAPVCYYKARAFDEISGAEIASSATANFRPEAVAYTTLNQRLRFYHPFTNSPATTCFEVRCPDMSDPADTLVGLIGMKSYETISIGGVNFPWTTTLTPRELIDYDPAIQTQHGLVFFATVPNDQIYINFISDPAGPFYNSQSVCEASTIDEASFHFIKPELPSYVPVPGDIDICTARIGFFDVGNFFNMVDSLDTMPTVSALSTWEESGTQYFYTDINAFGCSDVGGEFLYVCLKYRCSSVDAITTVRVDIDIPMIESNFTDRDMPAFYCKESDCVTDDCLKGDTLGGTVSIDGSFEAPVDVTDGPDFYRDSPNDCVDRAISEPFALTFDCISRGNGKLLASVRDYVMHS